MICCQLNWSARLISSRVLVVRERFIVARCIVSSPLTALSQAGVKELQWLQAGFKRCWWTVGISCATPLTVVKHAICIVDRQNRSSALPLIAGCPLLPLDAVGALYIRKKTGCSAGLLATSVAVACESTSSLPVWLALHAAADHSHKWCFSRLVFPDCGYSPVGSNYSCGYP